MGAGSKSSAKSLRTGLGAHKRGNKQDSIVDSVPDMEEVLKMKESAVMPLNYSCEFSRLTQLFGRALQIKYYAK